jgi:molybdopterin-synthase adenylyltransferase
MDVSRYHRQMLFPAIGEKGQARLAEARVVVVGCGALGTAVAEVLARAGVGYLRLVDRDVVEWSNLQRQSLYTEADCREHLPKAIAAARHLDAINSTITVEEHVADLIPDNARQLLSGVDLILDGTDNFETRLLVNDFAVSAEVPWIYGGVLGAYGATATFLPGETACFQCLFQESTAPLEPASCDTVGILAPIIRVVAAHEAMEALKLLTGNRAALRGTLLLMDLWENRVREIAMRISAEDGAACPCCGQRRFRHLDGRSHSVMTVLCGRESVLLRPGRRGSLDLAALEAGLHGHGPATRNEYVLKLEVEGLTLTIFPDGRMLVHGTDDEARARSLYARYIGP